MFFFSLRNKLLEKLEEKKKNGGRGRFRYAMILTKDQIYNSIVGSRSGYDKGRSPLKP